jgi:hypothetical protein
MTYARARLWLGISGVGVFVILSALTLILLMPHTWFPYSGGPFYADWAAFWVLYLSYALISLPLDIIGGHRLPCVFGRLCFPIPVFLMKWTRGVFVQGFIMTGSAMLLLTAGRNAGRAGAIAAFIGLEFALLLFMNPIARLSGGLSLVRGKDFGSSRRESILSGLDPSFSGGFSGFPGAESIVLPEHWTHTLAPDQIAAQLRRREGILSSGAHLRGMLVAIAWNSSGFALCTLLPGAGVSTVAELVTSIAAFALWSFLGLLVLPSLSRPAVLEADAYALASGVPYETLTRTLVDIDRFQEDEPNRSLRLERIFYPIPSVEARLHALRHPSPAFGAWNAARLALFLSWAGFGVLSRAVHCNSGRPELWVMLPTD